MPSPTSAVEPVPAGRTARRLEWQHLPPPLRQQIEDRCGSPVVEALSQGGGFTPGFASVLVCADDSRHFVKAASTKAQRLFAESYREEARKVAALPPEAPAARLRWLIEDEWVALELEYVDGRTPKRPWRSADLDRVLDTVEQMTRLLTPAPSGLALASIEEELSGFVDAWEHLRTTRPDLPHLEEAADLAAGFAEVTAGTSLVHTDLRDDNILLGKDDRVWICDWNWPVVGAPWVDIVFLLVQARGDGLDVDAILAERPSTREVPAEHVDRVLALLAGYFFRQADEPPPPASPYLRQHQAWCAQAVWGWLAERRGWT